MTNTRPKNVGIVDFAFYLPRTYVDQGDLEQFDGVSAGKYTIGLEQSAMAVCADNEDACSMSLTVVEQLVSRVNGGFKSIGRLEVGTESIVDKSKSIKTHLMRLFEDNHTDTLATRG